MQRLTPEKLKKTRAKLGLTQTEMAAEVGCSPRYYEYREAGTRPIKRMFSLAVSYLMDQAKKAVD